MQPKNANQVLLKIIVGVLVVTLAGAISVLATAAADSRVHAARIDALECERKTVADRLDKFDERLQRIEREVIEANAKLDTMMKDRIAERKP